MGKHTSTQPVTGEQGRSTLGEWIHVAVRRVIEAAVEAESAATLGAGRYERCDNRQGHRNGTKTRTRSGPTEVLALTLPRATRATGTGRREWTSPVVPRYQRRPKHVLDELRADSHRIAYAPSAEAARAAWTAFERTWGKRCPGVVKSLRERGAELLPFFTFPPAREDAGRAEQGPV